MKEKRNGRIRKTRNEIVKKSISTVPGIEAKNTDWEALREYSIKSQRPRKTLSSLVVTKKRAYPGSPCYNSEHVDYVFHRVVPALTANKHPQFAEVWATTSPRWGNTKIVGGKQRASGIKRPWEFKVENPPPSKPKPKLNKQFYYRKLKNGVRQKVKMPKRRKGR